ncbi:hypothetical protein L4D76_16850 [Photobacterium sagamiensis]|uniref:hypothetical protein n=1 Tax=Photobacterium sagamiensis TaxID=2910241 RepID=UPI003D0EF3C6
MKFILNNLFTTKQVFITSFAVILMLLPGAVSAHGFAQRYDLPVPLMLYLIGAAATVAVSFVVIALFVRRGMLLYRYPCLNLMKLPVVRFLQHPLLIGLLQALSIVLFVLILTAGWFGVQDPFQNIAPTLVWVIWWVGFAYVSGLLGNFWPLVNPWANIFTLLQWLVCRYSRLSSLSFNVALPRWIGVWPAVMLFAAFSWIELVWRHSDEPANIASMALGYSLLTWTGMVLFGKEAWLQRGEAFTLVFGLLARFAPSEWNNKEQERRWLLRPFGVGLLVSQPVSASLTVFVVLMLSVVTFDGFMATPLWASTVQWILYSDFLRPLLILLQPIFGDAVAVIMSLGFVLFPALFISVYYTFCLLMRLSTGPASSPGIRELAGYFVMTLIPIALAYHLAHYMSFLLIVGQYIIPLLSDPFGFGWDLFGTKHYFVDIGIVNARFVWITSVIAIVTGHIFAVFLSHVMAQRIFDNQRQVLLSQLPMLVLMVGYTMVSLWILAQPIVE